MGLAAEVFGPYENGAQSFADFEQFDQFVLDHEIPEMRQNALFISSLAPKVYATLCSLTAPDKPTYKTLHMLKQIMGDHYSPSHRKIETTHTFHCRRQNKGEKVEEYAAHILAQATNCNFGASRERALQDQFIRGLICGDTKQLLLSVDHLTVDQAVDIAVVMEASNETVSSAATARDLLADSGSHSPRDTRQSSCESCGPPSNERHDDPPLYSTAEAEAADMARRDSAAAADAKTTAAIIAAQKPTDKRGENAERDAAAMTTAVPGSEAATVKLKAGDVKAESQVAEQGAAVTTSSASRTAPQAHDGATISTTAPATETAAAKKTVVSELTDLEAAASERGAAATTNAAPTTVLAEQAAVEEARSTKTAAKALVETAVRKGRRPHKQGLGKTHVVRRPRRSAVT